VLHDYIAGLDSSLVRLLPEHRIERSYFMVYHESARDLARVRTVADHISATVAQEHKGCSFPDLTLQGHQPVFYDPVFTQKTKRLPGLCPAGVCTLSRHRTGAWEEDPGANGRDYCHAELGGGGVRRGVDSIWGNNAAMQ
jgi:hypothetical protein